MLNFILIIIGHQLQWKGMELKRGLNQSIQNTYDYKYNIINYRTRDVLIANSLLKVRLKQVL